MADNVDLPILYCSDRYGVQRGFFCEKGSVEALTEIGPKEEGMIFIW